MNGRIRPPSIACTAPMQLAVAWTFINNGPLYTTRQRRAPSTVTLDISLCLSAPARVPAVYRSTLLACLPAGQGCFFPSQGSPLHYVSWSLRILADCYTQILDYSMAQAGPQRQPKPHSRLDNASPNSLRTSQAEDAGKTANHGAHD
ncbi:hypothetical protein MRS44_006352 [Fusarium solani]|uniref:uncharacterized protein n=1 Tax=Fusarium solani TaxID=169388 RepID=UPI0032C4AAAA|nr:hypothetical protein MRS44_006352 [Fusarium solani]